MSFLRRLFGRPNPDPEEPVHEHTDEPVPGWDAISAKLDERYGGQEPMHWGTVVRWRHGGPDPLDGLSAYRSDGPPPHWHYVSYGLSELYRKESDVAERSGWGLELTFRLARTGNATDSPPPWPISLLQNLGRYIFESGNVLWPGHHIDAHGRIATDEETRLAAMLFVEDPELGRIDTPHGSVRFVQVVGITADEYEAVRRWNTDALVALLRRGNPLVVTDLTRRSILDDPATAAEVKAGVRRDGSSMAGVYLDRLAWTADDDGLVLTIGAATVEDVRIMLEGRLALGREAFLQGPDQRLDLGPGDAVGWHEHPGTALALTLPPAAIAAMASLPTRAGTYRWAEAPGVTVHVEPTIVTDSHGHETGRIG